MAIFRVPSYFIRLKLRLPSALVDGARAKGTKGSRVGSTHQGNRRKVHDICEFKARVSFCFIVRELDTLICILTLNVPALYVGYLFLP